MQTPETAVMIGGGVEPEYQMMSRAQTVSPYRKLLDKYKIGAAGMATYTPPPPQAPQQTYQTYKTHK